VIELVSRFFFLLIRSVCPVTVRVSDLWVIINFYLTFDTWIAFLMQIMMENLWLMMGNKRMALIVLRI